MTSLHQSHSCLPCIHRQLLHKQVVLEIDPLCSQTTAENYEVLPELIAVNVSVGSARCSWCLVEKTAKTGILTVAVVSIISSLGPLA